MIAVTKGTVLAAEKGGKIKTVFQICAASFLMAALALMRDMGMRGGVYSTFYWIGMVLFIIATILTIQSGMVYLTKYSYLLKEEQDQSE